MSKILILSNQLSDDLNRVSNPVLKTIYLDNKININVDIDYYAVDVLADGKYAYFKLILFLISSKRLLAQYKYIHVHFGGITSFIASCFIKSQKLIVTFHGTDLHGGIKKKSLKSFITRYASIFSCHRANKVSVVSSTLKKHIPKYLLHKIKTIPTGVDLDLFAPGCRQESIQNLGLDKNKKYLLFADISRSKVKRYDIAKKTIDLLKEKDGSFEMLRLSGVPHGIVPMYLNACHAILIVSDNEGSPSIVKEAIATHTPIFSTDVGDVWSYLGLEDLKLPSQNPHEIADMVNKFNFKKKYFESNSINKKIDLRRIKKQYYELYI